MAGVCNQLEGQGQAGEDGCRFARQGVTAAVDGDYAPVDGAGEREMARSPSAAATAAVAWQECLEMNSGVPVTELPSSCRLTSKYDLKEFGRGSVV
jgi:hypothetical protein